MVFLSMAAIWLLAFLEKLDHSLSLVSSQMFPDMFVLKNSRVNWDTFGVCISHFRTNLDKFNFSLIMIPDGFS